MPSAVRVTVMIAVLAPGSAAQAGKTTADQIIAKMVEIDPFTYGGAEAEIAMALVDERGQQTTRQGVLMSRTDGDDKMTFIRFSSPPDIAGTAFVGVVRGATRTQHIFLPALAKVRRISSSQRNGRFVGTDYSFADLDYRDVKDSKKARLADESVGGQDCYVLDVVPASVDSEYRRIRMWIAKRSWLPVLIKYYGANDQEVKRFVIKSARKRDGRWIVEESKMTELARRHATVMRLLDIRFRTDIPLEQFTPRALSR